MRRDIWPAMTVREIAVAWPELIEMLEASGIDYCCGGGRTVAQVAAEMGLSASRLVEELSCRCGSAGAPGPDPGWSQMSMSDLADHIERTHHAFVRETLSRLDALLRKCVAAHAAREPRFVEMQKTVLRFTHDMHDHMIREERVLFPWLRRLERPSAVQFGPPWSVRRPIDCMIHDHDDAHDALLALRELTDEYAPPPDACPTWREVYRLLAKLESDTYLHIHKENNILFPAGIAAEERRGVQHSEHRAAGAGNGPTRCGSERSSSHSNRSCEEL